MNIEQRGKNSFRAKVYDGKNLAGQQTFHSRAEAATWWKFETAKLLLATQLPVAHPSGSGVARHGYTRPDLCTPAEAAAYRATTAAPDAGLLATIALREFEADQMRSEAAPAAVAVSPKFRVIIERYRDEVTTKKKSEAQETNKIDAILLVHPIVKKRMADLKKGDFQKYRNERLKVVSPSTVKKELHLMHAIIEFARDEWQIDLKENPASVRQPAGADIARDRRLVDDEEARLLLAADPLMNDAIILAIDTAMRQGEILKLRGSMLRNMGTEQAYIALPGSVTKSGKPRDVPLSLRAHDMLARRKEQAGDGILLPVTSQNAFKMNFRRTCKRAKITGHTFHDLRHEGTSRLFESRLYTQAEIMKITGHESDAMVRRYLKTSGAELATRQRA